MINKKSHFFVLFILCVCLFLFESGSSLWDMDEAMYAQTALEMMENHDLVIPTLNGQIFTEKPPLHYWLMIAAYKIFGENEFSARLFPAIFGLLTVLLTAFVGTKLFGPAAGFFSGLCLATTFLFTVSSKLAIMDPLLVFFSSLAIFTGFFSHRRRSMSLVSWSAMGFAVLTKGPIGIILPLGTLFIFFLWRRKQFSYFRYFFRIEGFFLFIIIVCPWYILAAVQTKGAMIKDFFWVHNISRYLKPMEGHHGSILYFPLAVLLGFCPWSVFLPQAVVSVIRPKKRTDEDRSFGILLLVWTAVVLVFFSLSQSKLPTYILPIFPALSLMMGSFIRSLQEIHPNKTRGMLISWLFLLVGCISLLILLYMGLKILVPELVFYSFLIFFSVSASFISLYLHLKKRFLFAFHWAAYTTAAVLMLFYFLFIPALEPYRMAPTIGKTIFLMAKPSDSVAVMGYQRFSLVFYGKKKIQLISSVEMATNFLSRPEGRFLVVSLQRFNELPFEVRSHLKIVESGIDIFDANRMILLVERPEVINVLHNHN